MTTYRVVALADTIGPSHIEDFSETRMHEVRDFDSLNDRQLAFLQSHSETLRLEEIPG